jgi:NAD(P)-dependent dehydrogenase (short-subunit alcohol dehydrogenase family)
MEAKMEIQGKTALVTGGAHRVGKAMVMALAGEGANVVINYHASADEAEATAREVRALGVGALAIQCDISVPEQVQAMVAQAASEFGGVDILVNSASWFQKTPFPIDDFQDWHRVFDILVHGSLYCANYAAPLMKAGGEGAIINILDSFAWRPQRDFAAHSVGKAGLLALTRALALELAPEVRVNAVSPGPVLPPPGYSETKQDRIAKHTLLQRWGTPQDVADAVLFLIRASYITGEFITVDGGEQYTY